MDNVTEYRDSEGRLLAYKVGRALGPGLQAYSKDPDFVQALSWNYGRGKRLQNHVHKVVGREALRTQEAVVVVRGRLRADLFDEARRPAGQTVVEAGECLVVLAGGHGYEILEDDTHAFEIKNGPYLGLEADKEKF